MVFPYAEDTLPYVVENQTSVYI